jgi:hypothetical protein
MAVIGVVARWFIPQHLILVDNVTISPAHVPDVRKNREVR